MQFLNPVTMLWRTHSAASMADRGEMTAKEIRMAKYYCSEKVNGHARHEDTRWSCLFGRYLDGALHAGGDTQLLRRRHH